MESINSYNFCDYILNFDKLDDEQLEQLNIVLKNGDIEEKVDSNGKKIRKIVFKSRNGEVYDNFEDFVDANRRYCNGIQTVRADNNRPCYTDDDVFLENRAYWNSINLDIDDNCNSITACYYLFHLNDLNSNELELLKIMIRFLDVSLVKDDKGNIERKFVFISRNERKYSNFKDFVDANRKYCNAIPTIRGDDNGIYYASEDAYIANREYWNIIYKSINSNSIVK